MVEEVDGPAGSQRPTVRGGKGAGGGLGDAALSAAVEKKLRAYEPLRASGMRITVSGQDGVVRLAGVVRSGVHKYLAEMLAQSVARVRAVENGLQTDDAIAAAVAAELAKEGGIKSHQVTVQSFLGNVRLRGKVPSGAVRTAAAARAAGVTGVVGVANELTVEEGG